MVEVVELFRSLEGEEAEEIEDQEGVASFWHSPSAAGSVFDSEIRHRHCFRCHSNGTRSGDLRSFLPCLPLRSPISMSSVGFALQIPSDFDSEANHLRERLEFDLDLSDRCSPAPNGYVSDRREVVSSVNARDPFSFGVFPEVEGISADYLDLEPELSIRFGDGMAEVGRNDHGVVDFDGEELFFHGRSSALEYRGGYEESSITQGDEGLEFGGFGSEFNSREEDEISALRSPSRIGEVLDLATDNASFPLCWDCLPAEGDRRELNEDFEWEEINEPTAENDNLRAMMEFQQEDSSLLDNLNRDLEFDVDELDPSSQNIEWEVLLTMNNLERNSSIEQEDQDGFVHAPEYEVLFGQFVENSSIRGAPPAAKSIIENLPSVFPSIKNNILCAVCKEEMSTEEKVKELPCLHHYHEECIVNWLRIRNTCPVCRHELPTDDPDYEKQRDQRVIETGVEQ